MRRLFVLFSANTICFCVLFQFLLPAEVDADEDAEEEEDEKEDGCTEGVPSPGRDITFGRKLYKYLFVLIDDVLFVLIDGIFYEHYAVLNLNVPMIDADGIAFLAYDDTIAYVLPQALEVMTDGSTIVACDGNAVIAGNRDDCLLLCLTRRQKRNYNAKQSDIQRRYDGFSKHR